MQLPNSASVDFSCSGHSPETFSSPAMAHPSAYVHGHLDLERQCEKVCSLLSLTLGLCRQNNPLAHIELPVVKKAKSLAAP